MIKFLMLWWVIGLISFIILTVIAWADGGDTKLKDILWGILLSFMGPILLFIVCFYLIAVSDWWLIFSQKLNNFKEFRERKLNQILIKGRQPKEKE